MPQLIIAPYSHIYISIICILSISFLLFLKYFLPSLLMIIKLIVRTALTSTNELLFQIFCIHLQPTTINMISINTVNLVFLNNALFIRLISCFCREYTLSEKLCKYTNNNIFSYLHKDIN